ncbi:MAG: hypothetical protein AVDCRST_MAG88-1948, partial [uncultured Thermomicrobiales bacterium]
MTGTTATPAWLDGARVAPSAHNTQPWRFTPLPDGRIAVRWRPERALPVTDPTGRDLYLALGAAVESALLRAAAAGPQSTSKATPTATIVPRTPATREAFFWWVMSIAPRPP